MTYYRLIISLFIASLGQGVFATSSPAPALKRKADKKSAPALKPEADKKSAPALKREAEADKKSAPALKHKADKKSAPVTTTRGRTRNIPCPFRSCSYKARDNYGLRNHIQTKHPSTVPAQNSKRKSTEASASTPAASATSATSAPTPANASKYPRVEIIIKHMEFMKSYRPPRKQMKLNNWLTKPSLSHKLEKALIGLENGGSLSKLSKEFSIHEKYLEKFFNILTRINLSTKRTANFIPKSTKEKYSKYRGVSRYKKKWVAYIIINGKQCHLGSFKFEGEAALAYDEEAHKVYGPEAKLNFPVGSNFPS